ncbi:MAG: AraC family transcriptional regulator ligand-binding domain-containing protein [Parvularculaceae bacterium]
MTPRPAGTRGSTMAQLVFVRQALARHAADPAVRADVLARAGVGENALADPGGCIALDAQIAIAEALIDVVGPNWAVADLSVWAPASLGALDVAARASPTLEGALALMEAYGAVRAPQFAFTFVRDANIGELRLNFVASARPDAVRLMGEAAAVSAFMEIAAAFGAEVAERMTASFPWPAPGHVDDVRAAIAGPCVFDAPRLAVSVPAALLATPSPFADPDLLRAARADLERAARAGATPLAAHVEARLADAPSLTIDDAAAALGFSLRTFARRLAEEGTTFKSLKAASRRREAARLIAETTLGRDAVARELGFDDPTSFSRACRRWFGAAFRDARRALREPPDHQPH